MAGYQITLMLTPASMAFVEDQRKRWYPGHANRTPAHLTLIYHTAIAPETLRSCLQISAFQVRITGLTQFKNGVAYVAEGEELMQLQACLIAQCGETLSQKDLEIFAPHITICNQVTAFKAKRIFEQLSGDFSPFTMTATGISCNSGKETHLLSFDV